MLGNDNGGARGTIQAPSVITLVRRPSSRDRKSESEASAEGERLRSPFQGRTAFRREAAGFVLRELHYGPLVSLPPHSHETAYLSLVLEGHYHEHDSRRTRHLRPDTMLLRPAGDTHANQFARSGARIFCIEFAPGSIRRLRVHDVDLSKSLERRGGPAVRLGHRLYQQFRRMETASTLAMEGLILEILSELLWPEQSDKDSRHFPWMKRVLAFLQESYREPVSLAKTAQVAGVHPVHLARSFRRTHGLTLGEYVRRLRIEDARRRLITTDTAITEVALECGFSDHSHFARVFRRHMGVSPGKFRRAHRR